MENIVAKIMKVYIISIIFIDLIFGGLIDWFMEVSSMPVFLGVMVGMIFLNLPLCLLFNRD
jgi:hypothetical protein